MCSTGRTPGEIARRAGFPVENLLFWHEGQDEFALFRQLRPGAILTKESGESGYYEEKITAARQLGIPVIVIRRPPLPDSFYTVNGEHGLRYRVERLLPASIPSVAGSPRVHAPRLPPVQPCKDFSHRASSNPPQSPCPTEKP